MKDKIKFKDISVWLKIAAIGGFFGFAWLVLVIISFIVGFVLGMNGYY